MIKLHLKITKLLAIALISQAAWIQAGDITDGSAQGGKTRYVVLRKKPGTTLIDNYSRSTVYATSPDGKKLAVGDITGNVKVFTKTGKMLRLQMEIKGHLKGISALEFSSDGTLLATASMDKQVKVWWINGYSVELYDIYEPHTPIRHIKFNPNSTKLVTMGSDRTATLWDISGSYAKLVTRLKHYATVNSATFNANSSKVITVSEFGTTRVWDIAERQPKEIQLGGNISRIIYARFSPDGTKITTVNANISLRGKLSGAGSINLWDIATYPPKLLKKIGDGNLAKIRQVRFDQDGQNLIVDRFDEKIGQPLRRDPKPQPKPSRAPRVSTGFGKNGVQPEALKALFTYLEKNGRVNKKTGRNQVSLGNLTMWDTQKTRGESFRIQSTGPSGRGGTKRVTCIVTKEGFLKQPTRPYDIVYSGKSGSRFSTVTTTNAEGLIVSPEAKATWINSAGKMLRAAFKRLGIKAGIR